MPQWWYSTDGKPCGGTDEIGISLDDLGVKVGRYQLFIDAITPACNHEHWMIRISAPEY